MRETLIGVAAVVVGGMILWAIPAGWQQLKQRRAAKQAAAAARHRAELAAVEQRLRDEEREAKRRQRAEFLEQIKAQLGRAAVGVAVMQAFKEHPEHFEVGKITIVQARGSNPRTVLRSDGQIVHYFDDFSRYRTWLESHPSEAPRSFVGEAPELGSGIGDLTAG